MSIQGLGKHRSILGSGNMREKVAATFSRFGEYAGKGSSFSASTAPE